MILPSKENLLKSIILDFLKDKKELSILDCTCGNGHDTYFLASNFKDANIFAIDIQKEAIDSTKKLCSNFKNISYCSTSHDLFLQNTDDVFDFIIFNTGYLPKSLSNIKTEYKTTIKALDYGLKKLKENSLLAITLYRGHDDSYEYNKVYEFLTNLNKYEYIVFSYKTENTTNSPILFIIEKKEKRNI